MTRPLLTRPVRTRLLGTLAVVAFGCAAAGCSGSAASPATSSGSVSTTMHPAGSTTLRVTVTGTQVSPAPGDFELKAGQTLRLTVTSNHDDELHVHGFEKEVPLTAGRPTTLDLVTSQPGSYVVETHHPELRLLTILVR
ncbi:hypothetical protein [Nostocoides sp. HKS02]|uniref:hypothetical protein n=1 Tax=Nostocoides sp. HKS02 TaxID=1813880 RepID=UPI0012B4EA8B|nr:hypothetical protein [Tetrasphaera sp. HKS02]QGN57995.1 hypothetical protein GKE56_08975 [Tetrasphaera sp. HKS02]